MLILEKKRRSTFSFLSCFVLILFSIPQPLFLNSFFFLCHFFDCLLLGCLDASFVLHKELLYFLFEYVSFDVNHRDAKAKINCFWLVWSHNWHPNNPCFYCSYKNFKKQLQNQFYISPCVSLYFHLFLKVS